MAMRDADYIRAGGSVCPSCESNHIAPAYPVAGLGVVCQVVVCLDCKAEWEETYLLTRYTRLRGFKGQESHNA